MLDVRSKSPLGSGHHSSPQVITFDLKAHFGFIALNKLFRCEITITLPAHLLTTLHLFEAAREKWRLPSVIHHCGQAICQTDHRVPKVMV